MIYALGICLFFSTFGYIMFIWKLWLIDEVMDSATVILLGGSPLLLVGIGIRHYSVPLLWWMVVLMSGGSLAYTAMEEYYERASIREQQLHDLQRLKIKVQFNSDDEKAWRDLATLYMRLEKYDLAIDAYKNAIKQEPYDVADLRFHLNVALNQRKSGRMRDIRVCPHCKQATPRRSEVCIHCGTSIHFDFWKYISKPEVYNDIVRYVVLILASVAIVVLVLSEFPLQVKAVIAMTAVIVCAFLIWRSIDSVE